MLARCNCNVRGSSFCGSDDIAILWEQAGSIPIGREDDDRRFDVSSVGIDGIPSAVVIRFDRCHGGVCLQIYIFSIQHPLEELCHEFVRPKR